MLLTTYGMLLHNGGELMMKRGGGSGSVGAAAGGKKQQQQLEETAAVAVASSSPSFSWDAVVFDEGHCLKNPKTRIAELARSLDARMKVLLTGTPVRAFFPL